MRRRSRIRIGVKLLCWSVASLRLFAGPALLPDSLSSALEEIRQQDHLPALAGAIFSTNGIVEEAAVGVRKRDTNVPVTKGDQWSLGSDTKAMTGFLVGTYVAEGKLNWSTPVARFFPEFAAEIPSANRGITIGDVLSHSAGLKGDLDWFALARKGTVAEQRQLAARQSLLMPEFPPGSFHYANADYVLIAALLERMTGQSWEKLMTVRVFRPLHMDAAGFNRAASPGTVDEPWPHRENGQPMPPTDFKRTGLALGENEIPPLLAPAGLVHCTMGDWVNFLADQLRGANGLPALLPGSVYQAMQTSHPAGSPYGYGWGIGQRSWAGGTILEHEGSDKLNHAICLLAVRKGFGVIVCTNQGGVEAANACAQTITLLVNRSLASPALSAASSLPKN